MDDFDWNWPEGTEEKMREDDARIEEAKELSARQFVEYIRKHAKGTGQLKRSLTDIYKEQECITSVYTRFGINSKIPKPHECAVQLGYITILSTRPQTYVIIDKNSSVITLRPYQKHIIEEVGIQKGSVLIEAPTGAGKSVMASEIARNETEKEGKVLIVAPKLILLEQLQDTFRALNPQIIHGAKDYDKTHNVFISTIQTAHKRDLGFKPTMIMLDEVHFGFTGKMIEALLKDFDGRLIGLSATPYDKHGFPLKGFDKHFNKYDLNYMLQHYYLVHPFCYSPIKVDLSNIGLVAGDYNQGELENEFNNITNVMQIVETTKEKILERKATLVFCISISHAELMAQVFMDNGVPAKAMHSKLTSKEQNKIMQAYRSGELKVLTNPMMLTTGFDDPKTDCIVLARATKSQNLYRQMVGRALRLYEGKENAVVLDCAGVVEDLGLPTEAIKPRIQLQSKSKPICSKCGSENVFRRVTDSKATMVCADCGSYEQIEMSGIECESCGLMHSSKAKYINIDDVLYLECDSCQHHTVVSKASSKEALKAIFDENYIKNIQSKLVMEYVEYIIENGTAYTPFQESVNKHINALLIYIERNPTEFVMKSLWDLQHRIKTFMVSKEEDYKVVTSEKIAWDAPWKWEESGRLFGYKLEEELLNRGMSEVKDELEASTNLVETIKLINQLLVMADKNTLAESDEQELLSEIKKSRIPKMEKMCLKRLKDIYNNGEDITSIKGFVELMESVL